MVRHFALALALMLASAAAPVAAAPTVRDLVETVDLSGLALSPDGTLVAFRTEQASVSTNRHTLTWYVARSDGSGVREIAGGGGALWSDMGVLLAEPPVWSPDSRHLYVRILIDGAVQVAGGRRRVWRASRHRRCRGCARPAAPPICCANRFLRRRCAAPAAALTATPPAAFRSFALGCRAHSEGGSHDHDHDPVRGIARCLSFTYNKRVNRLATVQEHYMIARAIDRGVPATMIASALGLDEKMVMRRRNLLDGVAQEAVEILKDKTVNQQVFDILRKLKPHAQYAAAEMMASMNNFTASYARAILAATPQSDLAKPDKPKKIAGITQEQMARMERELEALNKNFRAMEATFGDDVLQLVLSSRYLGRLMGNANVREYLESRHPDIAAEFGAIVAATTLDAPASCRAWLTALQRVQRSAPSPPRSDG